MKIAIIEDEFLVANHLKTILVQYGFKVLGVADDYASALKLTTLNPAIFLVDIRLLNDESGIDVGKMLNEKNIPFIYLTANNELTTIKEAVKTHPQAYLTKPFSERDVIAALELFSIKNNATKTITVKTPKGKKELFLDEILYIEADNVYSKIVTVNKTHTERATLKEVSKLLDDNFVRVHRSYVINKKKITSKKANVIYINQIEIPCSKNYQTFF